MVGSRWWNTHDVENGEKFPADTRKIQVEIRRSPPFSKGIPSQIPLTLPKTNSSPQKIVVSKPGISFSRGLFSRAMLVSGRVVQVEEW